MALLEHPIVETGLARLAGYWPGLQRPVPRLRLMPQPMPKPDLEALARASAVYADRNQLTPEAFTALTWLPDFAHSGRHLLMGHALSLLEAWSHQKTPQTTLADDASILMRLSESAGAFAAHLEPEKLFPVSDALEKQIKRLLAHRTKLAAEILAKALALLEASSVLQQPETLRKDISKLLEISLPHLIGLDGGPTVHHLTEYSQWTQKLFDATTQPLGMAAHNALDRAKPFLAMLLAGDRRFCFAPTQPVARAVLETAPLALAPTSQVARLTAQKLIVASAPQQINFANTLYVSSHGKALLEAGLFQHDEAENAPLTFLSSTKSDAGSLLHLATADHQRIVFLSPQGEDLRIEDRFPQDNLPRWLHIKLAGDARVSVARQGMQATITGAGRNLWQLTLRGAKIIPLDHPGQLVLRTTAPQVNWALKRLSRAASKTEKPEIPELPF